MNGNCNTVFELMLINLLKHVTNVHKWYGKKCFHLVLEQGKRQWTDRDSVPMQALREIIVDVSLLKTFTFYTHFN